MKRLVGFACAAAMAVTGWVAAPAQAEGLGSSGVNLSRSKIFSKQASLLDGRLSKQYNASTKLRPATKTAYATESIPRYSGSQKSVYLNDAKRAARKYGIPESLFLRLVQQESAWKPNARSHKGALGLAQLMPATARSLGVNPRDPKQNLEGGARYLKQMYKKFGSWRLALAAYNAGPGAVEKHGGVPPYRETRNYVRKILGS